MSEQRLRDLLRDRAAEVEETDLAGAAWAGARRTRQRRAAAVASAAVVAVVAGGAVVVATGDADGPGPARPGPTPTGPTVPTPTVTAAPGATPHAVSAGTQHGAAIWWAPDKSEEADLPFRDVHGVPTTIDLSTTLQGIPGLPVSAAFAVGDGDDLDPAASRVLVLASDERVYELDTSRLEPVADEGGNAYTPLSEESLAPDGRHLFLRQTDALLVVDLLDGGEWVRIDTPPWVAEGARWETPSAAAGLGGDHSGDDTGPTIWVPDALDDLDGPGTVYDVRGKRLRTDWIAHYELWEAAGSEAYGPQALDPIGIHLSGFGPATAQAMFPFVELEDPRGRTVSGMDAVVARDQSWSTLSVLVLPYGQGDGSGRWKGCCPVVGWLGGPDTLLFASRGREWRVLAWDVGTRRLSQVTELVGWVPGEDFVVASWADLGPR